MRTRIPSWLLGAVLLCSGAAWAQVDINTATEAELDAIAGMGPATTRRVLQERARQPFKDWADLIARVRGIGPANAARFSAQGYTVGGQVYAGAASAASAPSR
ncbi:MAG: helix-hairpin-helix domain-containing protein [Burkholderiaceae bacterium]|nr:helix-hairpin-helix domain-containing protein [Burkholderiaceae bacterium]MCO5102498.1 helix-hairpin-helix domain-containing protein [Burkholderiaceae bacterium]